MLRAFLRIIIPCLLLVLVLSAAKYMDSGKFFQNAPSVPESTVSSEAETTAPAAESLPVVETTIPETQPVETVPEETKSEKNSFLLTFAGDCTLGASPNNYYAKLGFPKTVGDDYGYPFRNVLSYFEEDDYSFVNLEGPLCDEGYPRNAKHVFHGSEAYVNILTQSSVEGVTLSNNHTLDYGQSGYESTLRVLGEAEVSYVERSSNTVVTLDSGLTIGLCATSYTHVENIDAILVSQIEELKQQDVDLIIYAPHWGIEGSYYPNADQKRLAHLAIDTGAHIVCGSHPHVLQPIEEYNGGVIYYSLGNFVFGGNCAPGDYDTALIQQEITLDADGNVTLGQRNLVPCSVSSVSTTNNFQPTPYEAGSREYNRAMSKLNGTFTGLNLPIV